MPLMTSEALELKSTGRENRRASLEMVAAAMAFATMACIAHGFRGQIAWSVVAFARIAVTMLMAFYLLRVTGAPLLIRGNRALWARSVFGSLGLLCTFYCLSRMPVTDTISIMATSTVWVTVILLVVFKERVAAHVWWHAALAVAGVLVMQRPTFSADSFPMFVAMAGSFIVAGAKVSLGRCGDLPSVSVVAHYATFASIAALVVCFVGVDAIVLSDDFSPAIWLWLLPMGLAGTIGQLLMTRAFGRGSTSTIALVGISQIAFSAAYDVAIWGHTFDTLELAGVAMIAAAIAMSVTTTRKAHSRDMAPATADGSGPIAD